jgi:hypothetical protein
MKLKHAAIEFPKASSALEWDMSKLSNEQLKHEYKICYENLHGSYIANIEILRGLLMHNHASLGVQKEELDRARSIWQQRLKRAQDELFERQVLV